MKNDNLTHDWLDYMALHKGYKKSFINEGIESKIIKKDIGLVREPRVDPIRGIVIHHTGTRDAGATISTLKSRKLSTNYEIDQSGNVYEYLNPDDYKSWATAGGANEHTIGIDVTHPSHGPWPSAQVDAVKELVNYLANKYGFKLKLAPDNVRMNWKDWEKEGENFTLFRHRNFVNTSCPEDFPMEKLLKDEDILSKAYSYIEDIGTSVYDKAKEFGSYISSGLESLISESLDKKIFIINDQSKNHIYKKYQKYFDSLLSFLKKELKLTKPVKINFLTDEENSKKVLGKTGSYVNHKEEIVIYTTGRHIKDIMRSLAHELVHHRQNIRGEFQDRSPTKHGYAQTNKHLRKMEKEAYLKGNIHFRDWEDNYKYRGEK